MLLALVMPAGLNGEVLCVFEPAAAMVRLDNKIAPAAKITYRLIFVSLPFFKQTPYAFPSASFPPRNLSRYLISNTSLPFSL